MLLSESCHGKRHSTPDAPNPLEHDTHRFESKRCYTTAETDSFSTTLYHSAASNLASLMLLQLFEECDR